MCSDSWTCICFVIANSGGTTDCLDHLTGLCADYPPCDRKTGEGCPPGHCCLDTCCPEGICSTPCDSQPAPPRILASAPGPRPTL
jgi:hypothetical protein